MSERLTVMLAPPRHGWLEFSLRSDAQELVILASYVPFDVLTELVTALVEFFEQGRERVARINCEPDEFEVRIGAGTLAGDMRVAVVHFPHSRRRPASAAQVFIHDGSAVQVGRCLWRAFRRLESQFERAHWSSDFPSTLVTRLGALTETTSVTDFERMI